MKRLLALLLALCLCCACALAEETAPAEADASMTLPSLWQDGQAHQIERKTYPMYAGSLENEMPEEMPLYFVDGVQDLPWMELNDLAGLMNFICSNRNNYQNYAITVIPDPEKRTVMFRRENDSVVLFDFEGGTITWGDYYAFRQGEGELYLNLLNNFPTQDSEGRPNLLSVTGSRERHSRVITLDLKGYGVPMLDRDGLYLVPMQTLATFFLAPDSLSLYFNQNCIILHSPQAMSDNFDLFATMMSMQEEIEEMAAKGLSQEEIMAMVAASVPKTIVSVYFDGPKGERSLALSDYGLHELCLELDSLYGLKDSHDIDSFMTYFADIGLLTDLMSADPAAADEAVRRLVKYWLDDGHSAYYSRSYLSEPGSEEAESGYSVASGKQLRESLWEIRGNRPGTEQGYSEIGDTAFITMDAFMYFAEDHYAADEAGKPSTDTFGMITKAHRQITREGSPIKNVVLDLSANTGGAAPAAVALVSWFLGDARLSLKDTFGGGESTAEFRADVNLDRVFDEQDTLAGRGLNLYCLISPVSFSCGNLVPWAFKADGRVKLLGSVSGGGSCTVWPMATAWGTSYAISGPTRLSFMKNGAYYDIDRGVEPDYVISSFERYYDREALIEFIHSLY